MYAGDHLPPHFHARMADGREALIEIDSLAVLRGSLRPRERAEAMTWAEAHADTLADKWKELNP
jgi:hypothetical protein